MHELLNLLMDWHHWAFEIISGGVFFAMGLLVPEEYNPAKRLVSRHDRKYHSQDDKVTEDDAPVEMVECPDCYGTGEQAMAGPEFPSTVTCPTCWGTCRVTAEYLAARTAKYRPQSVD